MAADCSQTTSTARLVHTHDTHAHTHTRARAHTHTRTHAHTHTHSMSHAESPCLQACMSEMHEAIRKRKRVVLVVETEKARGGIPMDVHEAQCQAAMAEVHGRGHAARVVHDALFANQAEGEVDSDWSVHAVPWYRYAELQDVSLRMIAQHIGQAEARPGSTEATGRVWINGDLEHQHWRLRTPSIGARYHLFVSPHNAGAIEFVEWLQAYLHENGLDEEARLRWTSDEDEAGEADYVLLYLTKDTWNETTREAGSDFMQQLLRLENAGYGLCLVHEMRTDRQFRGEPEFDLIYRKTYVAHGARGQEDVSLRHRLYGKYTALPMANGVPGCISPEHEFASVLVLLRHLCPKTPITDTLRSLLPEWCLVAPMWIPQMLTTRFYCCLPHRPAPEPEPLVGTRPHQYSVFQEHLEVEMDSGDRRRASLWQRGIANLTSRLPKSIKARHSIAHRCSVGPQNLGDRETQQLSEGSLPHRVNRLSISAPRSMKSSKGPMLGAFGFAKSEAHAPLSPVEDRTPQHSARTEDLNTNKPPSPLISSREHMQAAARPSFSQVDRHHPSEVSCAHQGIQVQMPFVTHSITQLGAAASTASPMQTPKHTHDRSGPCAGKEVQVNLPFVSHCSGWQT